MIPAMRVPSEPFPCPQCGAPVPARALACRECGSDAETGWSDPEELATSAMLAGAGLPLEDDLPSRVGTALGWGRPLTAVTAWLACSGLLVLLLGWNLGIRMSAVLAVILLALLIRLPGVPREVIQP